jgi:hypothetical protein
MLSILGELCIAGPFYIKHSGLLSGYFPGLEEDGKMSLHEDRWEFVHARTPSALFAKIQTRQLAVVKPELCVAYTLGIL